MKKFFPFLSIESPSIFSSKATTTTTTNLFNENQASSDSSYFDKIQDDVFFNLSISKEKKRNLSRDASEPVSSSSRNPFPVSVPEELFPAAWSADTELPSEHSARLRGRSDWELFGDLAEWKSSQPFAGNFLT